MQIIENNEDSLNENKITSMFKKFPILDAEYVDVEKQFDKLCCAIAWDLQKKNRNNNCNVETEIEDVIQEIRIAVLEAMCYHKRQIYIDSSFVVALKYCMNADVRTELLNIYDIWQNRKEHGTNRPKFEKQHEDLLEKIVMEYVPDKMLPNKNKPIKIDTEFKNYCKSIAWNRQKSIGRKITKERVIKKGIVSLSENIFVL